MNPKTRGILFIINTEDATLSMKSTTFEGKSGVFVSLAVPQEPECGFYGLTGLFDYCNRNNNFMPGREGLFVIIRATQLYSKYI